MPRLYESVLRTCMTVLGLVLFVTANAYAVADQIGGEPVYLVDFFQSGVQRLVHWRYNEGAEPPLAVLIEDQHGELIGRVDYPGDRFVLSPSMEQKCFFVVPFMRSGLRGAPHKVLLEDTWTHLLSPGVQRITVNKQGGAARFVEAQTGRPVLLKGVNYIRLRHGDHATFEAATRTTAAHYDPLDTETIMRTLKRHGYNCVRVFIIGRSAANPGIAGEYETTVGLYEPYMDNVMDFLQRARRYGIYVLPTFGDGELPRSRYWRKKLEGLPQGSNAIYLTEAGIKVKKEYVAAFLDFIKRRDAELLKVLLGVQLQNELSLNGDAWPFTVLQGTLQSADGCMYDMGNMDQRQQLMDNGINHYHRMLVQAIKQIDAELLVTEGIFTLRAVGKSPHSHKGVYPKSSGDRRYPPTAPVLAGGGLDFLDVHFYHTRRDETVDEAFERDMQSILLDSEAMNRIAANTPVIMGEFGSFRSVEPTAEEAARNILRARDIALERGMTGFLMWTFDCFEQKRLRPLMEDGGALLAALADVSTPRTTTSAGGDADR